MRRLLLLALLSGPLALSAQTTPAVAARQMLAGQPVGTLDQITNEALALNFQQALVERLTGTWGRPAGYKAALTAPEAQAKFGVSQPLLGYLLDKMLLEDNAELSLNYAARPVAEADLLVRVSDPNINEARTDLELLAGLDAVIPFIELADAALPPGAQGNPHQLVALNAGARAGVQGTPIPVTANQEFLDRLRTFTVRLDNGKGANLGQGSGEALLGHPIHVVRWIRDTLAARGDTLREGDLLSLGTLTPLVPIKGTTRLIAYYEGLQPEDTVTVSVLIEESVEAE